MMPDASSRFPTNSRPGSKVTLELRVISFSELWKAYPSGTPYTDSRTRKPPPGFENQCAIRMSVALHNVGVEMQSFRGKGQIRLNRKRTAVLAAEMADWLKHKPLAGQGPTETITSPDWQQKIKGRTGIVAFKNYWRRTGESGRSGGHIDLWDGTWMTWSGIGGALQNFVRFSLGYAEGPGYSDLGNSEEILFWEMR